jgi:hypothetical protein
MQQDAKAKRGSQPKIAVDVSSTRIAHFRCALKELPDELHICTKCGIRFVKQRHKNKAARRCIPQTYNRKIKCRSI